MIIRLLDAHEVEHRAGELGHVLSDCVNGGASVSFMLPYSDDDGRNFYARVATRALAGEVLVFAGFVENRLAGTVMLGLDTPPNQPHRADVMKMLVHRSARRRGLARALLDAAEAEAQRRGRWLLVLDTVEGGDADRLYPRCGWSRSGSIPGYALFPAGGLCATVIYYKALAQQVA